MGLDAGPRRPETAVRYDLGMAAQDHLRVDVQRDQERAVVSLSGELDLAGAPIFERALESDELATAESVVLDLQGLNFVDSSGLRVILMANDRARERKQQFAITPGSPQVQRLLSITNVTDHLRVVASPGELST
jgi:anti-sigma B factor antagonist